MINSIFDWDDFERKVCSIIYMINPYQLSRYDGGPDRGRDIVAKFEVGDTLQNVIIECKYYKSGVNKSVITPALDWAKVHRPALLYFWVVPYLTPDAKDFIELFEKQYKICVLYEEQVNIEHYLTHLNNENHAVWSTLRNRVISACKVSSAYTPLFVLESNLISSEDIPYLIDREDERKTLLNSSQRAFFIQGMSACGKTQLMKYVSHIYSKNEKNVFWYTFRPEGREMQNKSFFQTLAHYFSAVYNDERLLLYFQEFGYYLSQDLENLILYLLRTSDPVIFLDDVHNCPRENVSLITFFEKIVELKVCRIYFGGWINILSSKIETKQNLSVVILDGLKVGHLNQIICHYSGYNNPAVAGVIAERFHGLPGYAVLVNEHTTTDDLESDRQFLHNFLRLLSKTEQILLFMLVYSSYDIPTDFLCRSGYALELESLKNKRLIIFRDSNCTVHDKYKTFFITYPSEATVFNKTILLMYAYAGQNAGLFFDIIDIYLERRNIYQAWETISYNFKSLLHCQQNTRFLKLIQKLEQYNSSEVKASDIIFKKIVLLERVGEYKLCLYYLTLLDFDLFTSEEREMLLYLRMRLFYFTNKYDELLCLFEKEADSITNFSSQETTAQILSIVGRVYYVRGLLKGALACYLLSYQYAFNVGEKALEMKLIHRIAMVECSYGLIQESRFAFEKLEKLPNHITPKRRSYIYYRIAKCLLLEGKLEEARVFNGKSKKLKESYGDNRGLVFSNKLDAKISLAQQEYIDAACSIQQAYSGAENIDVNKERLSCMLVQVSIMLESSAVFEDICCCQTLQQCLDIAFNEKLLFRVHTIKCLAKERYETIYLSACEKYRKLNKILSQDETYIMNFCTPKMEPFILKSYINLTSDCTSITPRLLLKSGVDLSSTP